MYFHTIRTFKFQNTKIYWLFVQYYIYISYWMCNTKYRYRIFQINYYMIWFARCKSWGESNFKITINLKVNFKKTDNLAASLHTLCICRHSTTLIRTIPLEHLLLQNTIVWREQKTVWRAFCVILIQLVTTLHLPINYFR